VFSFLSCTKRAIWYSKTKRRAASWRLLRNWRLIGKKQEPGVRADIMAGYGSMSGAASRRGVIPRADYEQVRTEIVTKLESMVDPDGRPLNTICYKSVILF
jgi:hypothetical protein